MRTYCKIIGTRERDYSGNAFGQGISQEMTVYSGGAGVPFTEDVIRASRDVFQMYGGKTSYGSGVFSSVMRSVAGQAFVCYGISQKQALGRDAQFTQLLITPREELLVGDAFRQEVLNHGLIGEEAIHRATRPEPEEVFQTNDYPRCEVKTLEKHRRDVLMRVASLLCTGRRVLLVERDEAHRRDFFRPVLRELFELIPAGHRYQIGVTTGRCEDDIERLGSAQLIVTDQPYGSTLDRQQLRLDLEEPVSLTSGEARWAGLTNAERDEFSQFVGGSDITLQTEYSRLMDCMDDDKSFWWASGEHNREFSSLEALFRRHDSTPILGMPRINSQFCLRISELLDLPGSFEDYYFELKLNEDIPYETRNWCLNYLTKGKLRKFGLSDEEFGRIEENYMNFENLLNDMHVISTKFDNFAGRQGDLLDALQAQVGRQGQEFGRQMEALQRKTEASAAQLEAFAAAQEASMERQFAGQEEKITSLRQSQDEFSAEQARRTEQLLSENEERITAAFAAQDARFGELRQAGEGTAQALADTAGKLAAQDARFEELRQAGEGTAQILAATVKKLTEQDARFEELRQAGEGTAQILAATAQKLAAQDARFEEIRRMSEGTAQAMTATAQKLAAQDARFEELRQAAAQAAGQNASLSARLDGRLGEVQAALSQTNPQKQIAEMQSGLDDFKRGMSSTLQEVLRRVDQPKAQPDPGIRALAQRVDHVGDDVEQLITRMEKTNASVVSLREHVRNLSGGGVTPGSGGGSNLLQWISIVLSALVLAGFAVGGVLFAGWQRTNSAEMARLAELAEATPVATATAQPEVTPTATPTAEPQPTPMAAETVQPETTQAP